MINAVKDPDGAARIAEAFHTAQVVIGTEFDHRVCGSRGPNMGAVFGTIMIVFKSPLDGSVQNSGKIRNLSWEQLVSCSQDWGGRRAAKVPVIRAAMKSLLDRVTRSVEQARAGFKLPSMDEHYETIRKWEEEKQKRDEHERLAREEALREARELIIENIIKVGFTEEDLMDMWKEAHARIVMEA